MLVSQSIKGKTLYLQTTFTVPGVYILTRAVSQNSKISILNKKMTIGMNRVPQASFKNKAADFLIATDGFILFLINKIINMKYQLHPKYKSQHL